jgi:hypothetical protein
MKKNAKREAERVRARLRLDKARLWVDVLAAGIGHVLTNGLHFDDVDALFAILEGPFQQAVRDSKLALGAYEPYRELRRTRSRSYNKLARVKKAKGA